MNMTRQHYQMIADTLKAWAEYHKPTQAQYRDLTVGFALNLRDTNPQFNSDRFLEACDYEVDNVEYTPSRKAKEQYRNS